MKRDEIYLSRSPTEIRKAFPFLNEAEHAAAKKQPKASIDGAPVLRIEATGFSGRVRYRVIQDQNMYEALDLDELNAILSRYLTEHIVGDIYAYEMALMFFREHSEKIDGPFLLSADVTEDGDIINIGLTHTVTRSLKYHNETAFRTGFLKADVDWWVHAPSPEQVASVKKTHSDLVGMVLARLGEMVDGSKALRQRGDEDYRKTIASLATEILGKKRRENVSAAPVTSPASPAVSSTDRITPKTAVVSAACDALGASEATQLAAMPPTHTTRATITLKTTPGASPRDMNPRSSRSKHVVYPAKQKQSGRPMPLAAPANPDLVVQSQTPRSLTEISDSEPVPVSASGSEVKRALPPHRYPVRTPRNETRWDTAPRDIEINESALPAATNSWPTAPTQASLASEESDSRIFLQDFKTFQKIAESLRKRIKVTGKKRYGSIRCFDILSEMFGYTGYGQLLDEYDSCPPSPSDSEVAPEERARRYSRYTAALAQHGLSAEQAEFVLTSSPPRDWLFFDSAELAAPQRTPPRGKTLTIKQSEGNPDGDGPSVSDFRIWFTDDVIVKRLARKLRNALTHFDVPGGYNRCLGYAARMFGHPSYNHLFSTFGTNIASLPDEDAPHSEQTRRLEQYVHALISIGLNRPQAVEIIQRCGFQGWLTFSNKVQRTDIAA